jgi:hypothetical protein
VLAAAGDAVLAWHAGAYVLTVDPLAVDLHRFEHLVERARTIGHAERSLSLLDEALGLWRGEAFAGLDPPWIQQVRTAWDARRVRGSRSRH